MPSTGDDLPQELRDRAVVVRAWATWCGSCRALAPVVEEVAASTDLEVFDLRIDTDPELVDQLSVRSVPTLIGLRDGVEVGRLVGLQPTDTVESLFAATSSTSAGSDAIIRRAPRSLLLTRAAAGAALVVAGVALSTVALIVIGSALSIWAAVGLVPR